MGIGTKIHTGKALRKSKGPAFAHDHVPVVLGGAPPTGAPYLAARAQQ